MSHVVATCDRPPTTALATLARKIVACRKCPRLVQYLASAKRRFPDHWCRPVPGWGAARPRLLIVGLAPGMHGANRTARMFTGDSSGAWLHRALHEIGVATKPAGIGPGDGQRLRGAYVTAAARCAPPQNRPTATELENCRPYLAAELALFRRSLRVVLALGRVAHEAALRSMRLRPSAFPFAHARIHRAGGVVLVDSYHPSRQNTQTGRLTCPMFLRALRSARRRAFPPRVRRGGNLPSPQLRSGQFPEEGP